MESNIGDVTSAVKIIDTILAELKKNKMPEMSELSAYHFMRKTMELLARLNGRIAQIENSKDEKIKNIVAESQNTINGFKKENEKFERNFYLLKTKVDASEDKTKLANENKNALLYSDLQRDFFNSLVRERYDLQRITVRVKNIVPKPEYDKMMR